MGLLFVKKILLAMTTWAARCLYGYPRLADLPAERGVLIVSAATHKRN